MAENYFMGQDGFVWFIGCVESRNDPAELGRVQVRCLGYHTENKEDIPTADLPWAHVMHPTTDPSMQGMGTTPSFLVEGTWVVGFFRDAVEKQQPIIMGSLPGYNQETANSDKGFNDPNGVYPAAFHSPSGHSIEESDINRLARNSPTRQHEVIGKKDKSFNGDPDSPDYNPTGRTLGVNDSNGGTWNEPPSPYNALYPKNHVFESESGHIKEYDDTPGFERIHEYHASGTFHEVDSNGTKRTRIVGNNYEVIAGDEYVNVKGTVNLTIDADCNTSIAGDWNIIVGKNKNEVIVGDYTQEVHENVVIKYAKDMNQNVAGNIEQKYGTDTTNTVDTEITGTTTETVGLIKNVNVVGDPDEDSPTFEQAVNETYNQKLITKVTKAVEETFTGGQKTLITGTLDLDATTEVDIQSGTVNLNKGTTDEGGTVEEVEKPEESTSPVKDAVGTLTSFGVNVIEGASNFILGAIGRFRSAEDENQEDDGVITESPKIPDGYQYFGDWNNFDTDQSDPEVEKMYQLSKNKSKSTTDFYGFTNPNNTLRQPPLNWFCDKETAGKILGVTDGIFFDRDTKEESKNKGKSMLSNEIFALGNDFDSAPIDDPATSQWWIWDGAQDFYPDYNTTPITVAQYYELLGIDPSTKQRVRDSALAADPRIRKELADVLTEIAVEWEQISSGEKDWTIKFSQQATGKQFYLTSGYRDPHRNSVAGSSSTNHRTGKAIDLSIRGWKELQILEFIDLCFRKGIQNIGTAQTFLHLDIMGLGTTKPSQGNGNWRRAWQYKGEEAAKYADAALPIFMKYGVKWTSFTASRFEQWDTPLGKGWIESKLNGKEPDGDNKVAEIVSPYNYQNNRYNV